VDGVQQREEDLRRQSVRFGLRVDQLNHARVRVFLLAIVDGAQVQLLVQRLDARLALLVLFAKVLLDS
jgi:hypothetical protein